MWEQVGLYLLIAGGVLLAAGVVMFVVAAFRTGWKWGVAVLGLLGVPFFLYRHWLKARLSLAFVIIGVVLSITPIAASLAWGRFGSFGPYETFENGERHLTLTGWSYSADKYAMLVTRPDAVVVQMANADVTDETLRFLAGMKNLRELDLSRTGITDEGLQILASFPKLESLRIADTAVTDAGFQERIVPLKSLRNLDLQRTKISGKALREWKNTNPDRKYLK